MNTNAQTTQSAMEMAKDTKATLTKEKIIDTAMYLFLYNGWKNTSIDQIVGEAGQSKGAFFHHFKSKNEMTALALQKYAQVEIFEPMEKHFTQNSTPSAALKNWGMEQFKLILDRKFKGGNLLTNMASEIDPDDHDLRETIANLMLDWENRLVAKLKFFETAEKLTIEDRQLARLVIFTLQGIYINARLHQDQRRTTREFQAFGQLITQFINTNYQWAKPPANN